METLSITNCPDSYCNSKNIFKLKWKSYSYDEQLYRWIVFPWERVPGQQMKGDM